MTTSPVAMQEIRKCKKAHSRGTCYLRASFQKFKIPKASALLLLMLFFLVACQKEAKVLPKATPKETTVSIAPKPDTIPDKAAFKIKLVEDENDYDETIFLFDHESGLSYSQDEDGEYLPGFGQVSLASISSDGTDLSVNRLPYRSGMSIGLDVHTKTDGAFSLGISYENKVPGNIQIWIKDTYLKDSIEVHKGNYSFNVSRADTNSFGNKRFKLILKDSVQQQTVPLH